MASRFIDETLAIRSRLLPASSRRIRTLERQLNESREETARLLSELARSARELNEARLLVREVDHRAKNSLQLAASMLFLQAGSVSDFETRAQFDKAIERLQSLAGVHAALYQTADGGQVAVRAWLERIARSLKLNPHVAIVVEAPNAMWNTESATTLGLFINEAVANALKHGFPDGRRGCVWVDLRREGEGGWRLEVRDDGAGDPSVMTDGLGVRLLRTFARQLGGELQRRPMPGGGVCVGVSFPDRPPAPR